MCKNNSVTMTQSVLLFEETFASNQAPKLLIVYQSIHQEDKNVNPLTTDDECTHHPTLGTCYQLAQSVLKIRFCSSKNCGMGEGGGFRHKVPCTWQLFGKALVGTSWAIALHKWA